MRSNNRATAPVSLNTDSGVSPTRISIEFKLAAVRAPIIDHTDCNRFGITLILGRPMTFHPILR